jgi:hypothetical protein
MYMFALAVRIPIIYVLHLEPYAFMRPRLDCWPEKGWVVFSRPFLPLSVWTVGVSHLVLTLLVRPLTCRQNTVPRSGAQALSSVDDANDPRLFSSYSIRLQCM